MTVNITYYRIYIDATIRAIIKINFNLSISWLANKNYIEKNFDFLIS